MKNSRQCDILSINMLTEADNELVQFNKQANYVGLATFGFFFCLPFINKMTLFKRSLSAFLPSYYVYNDHRKLGDELWWNKTFAAYQRFIVFNGMNENVFI